MNPLDGLRPLDWTVRVPLLTNRVIIRQTVWWAG